MGFQLTCPACRLRILLCRPMSFDTYCAYSDANLDELPLYLFDKTFPNTAPHLAADYTVGFAPLLSNLHIAGRACEQRGSGWVGGP